MNVSETFPTSKTQRFFSLRLTVTYAVVTPSLGDAPKKFGQPYVGIRPGGGVGRRPRIRAVVSHARWILRSLKFLKLKELLKYQFPLGMMDMFNKNGEKPMENHKLTEHDSEVIRLVWKGRNLQSLLQLPAGSGSRIPVQIGSMCCPTCHFRVDFSELWWDTLVIYFDWPRWFNFNFHLGRRLEFLVCETSWGKCHECFGGKLVA